MELLKTFSRSEVIDKRPPKQAEISRKAGESLVVFGSVLTCRVYYTLKIGWARSIVGFMQPGWQWHSPSPHGINVLSIYWSCDRTATAVGLYRSTTPPPRSGRWRPCSPNRLRQLYWPGRLLLQLTCDDTVKVPPPIFHGPLVRTS